MKISLETIKPTKTEALKIVEEMRHTIQKAHNLDRDIPVCRTAVEIGTVLVTVLTCLHPQSVNTAILFTTISASLGIWYLVAQLSVITKAALNNLTETAVHTFEQTLNDDEKPTETQQPLPKR